MGGGCRRKVDFAGVAAVEADNEVLMVLFFLMVSRGGIHASIAEGTTGMRMNGLPVGGLR
jgi:hypothetical protein